MAKNIYTVTSVDAMSTPTECKVSCYYSMTDAQTAFKTCVRDLMSGKLAFAYSGVHPKPGYKHEITNQFYKFYDGSTIRPLIEVYFGQSNLYSAGTSGIVAPGGGTVPGTTPSGTAVTSSPIGAPGVPGVSASAKPKVAGTPVATGKTKVSIPGVGVVEVDQSTLASALAAAIAGSGVAPVAGDPDGDDDDEEVDEDEE